jgi:hypothetical protein
VGVEQDNMTWEEMSELKHELQMVREHLVHEHKAIGLVMRVNTCLEILEKWILQEDA